MIRLPTQNDCLAIGHVYCEAWKAAYKGIVPDDYLNRLTDENCMPCSIRSKGALIYESDRKVLGVVSFGARRDRPASKDGEIYSIYVLPEYWRTGAGRALFEAAKEQLRAAGCNALFPWALTENLRAAGFYRKMGMTPVESRTIVISGRELTETGFVLTLN